MLVIHRHLYGLSIIIIVGAVEGVHNRGSRWSASYDDVDQGWNNLWIDVLCLWIAEKCTVPMHSFAMVVHSVSDVVHGCPQGYPQV